LRPVGSERHHEGPVGLVQVEVADTARAPDVAPEELVGVVVVVGASVPLHLLGPIVVRPVAREGSVFPRVQANHNPSAQVDPDLQRMY
jgi:hypothetical protein